jgi:hypothetical protein
VQVGGVEALWLGMECLSWFYGPFLTKPVDRKMDQSWRLAAPRDEREAHRAIHPIIASKKLLKDYRNRGLQAECLFDEEEVLLA